MSALPPLVLDPEGAACRGSIHASDHQYHLDRTGFAEREHRSFIIPGRMPADAEMPVIPIYEYHCIQCGANLVTDSPLCVAS